MLRKLHRISAGLIVTFAVFHLLNQLGAWFGIAAHTAYLTAFRTIYRIPVVECLLLLAFGMQIISGIGIIVRRRKNTGSTSMPDRLLKAQIWSGLYLSYFFVNHIGADLLARNVMNLDTTYYFGAVGLVTPPLMFYFVPYYVLAVVALFTHVGSRLCRSQRATINRARRYRETPLAGWTIAGSIVGAAIVIGMSGLLHPVVLPPDYQQALHRLGIS